MSPIQSLSDVGYRKFGPLPAAGGGLSPNPAAAMLARQGDYDACGEWVRRRARKAGSSAPEPVKLVAVLDRLTDLDGDALRFVADHFDSAFANADVTGFEVENATLLDLLASASGEPRWRGACRSPISPA